jgi:hypothetical protein
MIIVNPSENVLFFQDIEWAMEDGRTPKKAVKSYLAGIFRRMSEAEDESEPNDEKEELENEGSEEDGDDTDEDQDDEDNSTEETVLTDVTYGRFSISEDGNVLLKSDVEDCDDILLTDKEAAGILPLLQAKMEKQAKALQSLLSGKR